MVAATLEPWDPAERIGSLHQRCRHQPQRRLGCPPCTWRPALAPRARCAAAAAPAPPLLQCARPAGAPAALVPGGGPPAALVSSRPLAIRAQSCSCLRRGWRLRGAGQLCQESKPMGSTLRQGWAACCLLVAGLCTCCCSSACAASNSLCCAAACSSASARCSSAAAFSASARCSSAAASASCVAHTHRSTRARVCS
jgi:hypothetical protein